MLPEIKAYMAKARLRRGIEMVKLANRIEALKMQEDDPENPDFPESGVEAAEAGSSSAAEAAASGRGKLQNAMKGAIFREVVMAKVREMKEQEATLKVKEEVEKKEKRKSFQG